jgi:hypothetical protein
MNLQYNLFRSTVLAVSLAGCIANPTYNDCIEATKRGLIEVPHVMEIAAIFSNAPKSHFIEQLGLQPGRNRKPAKWNTVVWFYGRYELTYQVDVLPDYRAHRIKKMSPGRFYLVEVAETYDQGRGTKFDPSGNKEFGESEWEKIVAAKGDFAVLGVMLKTNSPVNGFDSYVSANQESSWSIRETPGHNPNSPGTSPTKGLSQ